MIYTAGLPTTAPRPLVRELAWVRARPWVSIITVIALWALIPEVRRVANWRFGYNSISAVSIIPMLALIPAALTWIYSRRARRLDPWFGACVWIWLGGFTYAYAVGVMTGVGVSSATYSYLNFVLPAIFAAWIGALNVSRDELYARLAPALLWLGALTSLYAAFQFVALPAWDAAWMEYAKIVSIGIPAPYQFRVYSTLNGPGIFADFLVAVIAINLPRLAEPRPLRLVALTLCLATLVLSMVRADYIALVLVIVVFLLLSPNRFRNIGLLATVVGLLAVVVVNGSLLLGSSDVGKSINARFSTFTNLSDDVSYNDRWKYYGEPLERALTEPLGEGLGNIGTAAKLGSTGQTMDFDNGYLARFTEGGYFGFACYLLAVVIGLVYALRTWASANRRGDRRGAAIAAGVAALQVAYLFIDIAGDQRNAFPGVLYWLSLAMIAVRRS